MTHPRRADAGALLILLLALCWTYRGYWGADPTDVVAAHAPDRAPSIGERSGHVASLVDQRFVVWLVSRNARTWLDDPTRLFDGEICHPVPESIAAGEPAFTLGLVGTPMWLVSRDPILTYNSVVIGITWIAALAMYLLVRDWTGLPAAGLTASLLYASHALKVSDPIHLYVPDTAWTVFALFFFRRFLEQGRWRDVVGLSAACALQIGGSLYPLLAAAAVGGVFAIWGVVRLGVARTRWLQWAALAAAVGAALLFVYAPYLAKTAVGDLAARPFQIYLPWAGLFTLPTRSLGVPLLMLAAAAFLPRGSNAPDPRLALLGGAGLALLLATGGNAAARMLAVAAGEPEPFALPNLFEALATLVPGLRVVRLPAAIAHGAHLAFSVLAGLGAAQLLRRVPAHRSTLATVALVLVVAIDTLRPGLPGGPRFEMRGLRPAQEELAFYQALDALGNEGPLLELPIVPRPTQRYSHSILAAAYHDRRTSACYNSFIPQETREIEALARTLPDAAAAAALAGHFTTLVVHGGAPERLRARLEAEARREAGWLTPLHADATRTAYVLRHPFPPDDDVDD